MQAHRFRAADRRPNPLAESPNENKDAVVLPGVAVASVVDAAEALVVVAGVAVADAAGGTLILCVIGMRRGIVDHGISRERSPPRYAINVISSRSVKIPHGITVLITSAILKHANLK